MTTPVKVSEHAVLRYIERVHDIPVEKIKDHIAMLCEKGASLGAACVKAESVRFVLGRDNTVITVIPEEYGLSERMFAREERDHG